MPWSQEYLVSRANASLSLSDSNVQYIVYSKVVVELTISDIQSALEHAWKQMRYEEPDIATTLKGETKVYETPDEAALQKWLDSTFTFIVTDIPDAEELQRNELVLRAHHCTIDGVGILMLKHKFFSALVQPKSEVTFGDGYQRLAVPLPEALGNPEPPTPEQTERATTMAPVGQCQNIKCRLSPDMTAAIVQACNGKGITVATSVHAAYSLGLMKHANPLSNTPRYTTVNSFNLRDYLPAPYNKSAAANYPTTIPFTIDLPADFSQLAQALNHRCRNGVRGSPEVLELVGAYNRFLVGMVRTPKAEAAPAPTDACVSSLGVIEKYLQRSNGNTVTEKDYKIVLDVVLGIDASLLSTFKDQLRLVYSFNDGVYGYEEPTKITEYVNHVAKVLNEELLGSAAV
ncbi:uncharacterized protein BDW43DRAFT_300396 [Aspergillus alliaceus]|uniref:uncharacterized protein n=1 Tax=Petromyces alliaceus TaxID=209559 RepID=UPI0012A615B3|nr:uncharacterized protein BDW43DRAFT_300396 [Aspergillus alliaceus]KAB8233207.1 hypothetical protein BDW43DRAFT_300396 [Aspergillus alliaceus]